MTTVLVVEDEPLIAFAIEAELEDAGYQVITAPNGRQGLEELAKSPHPDLVLTDMMMPVMSGPEMLAAIGANPALRVIPVIVLSSLSEAAVRARVNGVSAILRKPCTAHRLLTTVAQVLGERSGP